MNPALARTSHRFPPASWEASRIPRATVQDIPSDNTGGGPERDQVAESLWNEHGWSLTGWQVAALLAAVTAISEVLHYLA